MVATSLEPERDAIGEILDVHEPPRLTAVAGERQRLAAQRLADERGDHRRLARAGSVGDPESQDRVVDPVELLVGLAVQLARELGAGVEVARRRKQRVLVDRCVLAVGVDPDRRGVDDPLDARAPRRLEHGNGAAGVDPLGVLGLGMDVVDVGDRGKVGDRVAAVQRALERLAVGDRAEHGVDRARLVPGRRAQVVDDRLVSARAKLVDHVRADEARSACYEDSHVFAPCPSGL